MTVTRFSADVTPDELRRLTPPPPSAAVADLIDSVRKDGDAAVLAAEQAFAPPGVEPSVEPLTGSALTESLDALDSDLRVAIELAIENVREVSAQQVPARYAVELPQGHSVESRVLAVDAAAAYVPGGRGSYPSTAVMCLVPAQVAGVGRIVLLTPARDAGGIDPTVAAVCALLDVDEVYPIGGAQAIAAVALGTQTINPVDVIVGPGNAYVQEAKRQLYGTVGVDGVAGPSELAIVADASADPRHLALDLMAQAEHGPDGLVVLASDDEQILEAVARQVEGVESAVAIIKCDSPQAALALADDLAPEHMQIACTDRMAGELAARVRRAGCVFVGNNAATAYGDYVAGSNHVLPTGGAARYASALTAATFMRRMSVVEIPDSAVAPLSQAGARIADAEGFTAHAASMRERAGTESDR
jgi:histidinol dehydrogenase